MRSTNHRVTPLPPFAFLVLMALSACASAQDATLLVQRFKDGKNTAVWHAVCTGLKADSTKQDVTCKLERAQCTTDCKFTTRSTDQPPVPLIFGVSETNPVCAWVFDSAAYRYTYRCW